MHKWVIKLTRKNIKNRTVNEYLFYHPRCSELPKDILKRLYAGEKLKRMRQDKEYTQYVVGNHITFIKGEKKPAWVWEHWSALDISMTMKPRCIECDNPVSTSPKGSSTGVYRWNKGDLS